MLFQKKMNDSDLLAKEQEIIYNKVVQRKNDKPNEFRLIYNADERQNKTVTLNTHEEDDGSTRLEW